MNEEEKQPSKDRETPMKMPGAKAAGSSEKGSGPIMKTSPEERRPSEIEEPQGAAQESEEIPEDELASSPPRRRSVFVYLAVLFGAAFLLLLFAYLMQQRDSEEIIGNLSDLRQSLGSIQSIDQLVEENRQLREENASLKGQVSDLEKQGNDLKDELEISSGMIDLKEADQQEAWNIISALDTLARLRTLYDADRLDEAKEQLAALPRKEGTDEVEYYLNVYRDKAVGIADSELYDPLAEWQELKAVLMEEEEEEK